MKWYVMCILRRQEKFVNTLGNHIHEKGATNKLVSDSSQVEISDKVQDIVRAFYIDTW